MNNRHLLFSHQWPQYVSALSASLAIFNSGVVLFWPTSTLPKLFSEEIKFKITQQDASLVTTLTPLSCIVGIILSSALMNKIGRKPTLLLCGLPIVISFIFVYFSFYIKPLLFVAAFLAGIGTGGCVTTVPVYIAEITEPKIRGQLGTFHFTLYTFGMLAVVVVGSYCSYKSTAIIFAVESTIFLLVFLKMPETPYYLMMKKDMCKARKALKFFRNSNMVEMELQNLKSGLEKENEESTDFKSLLTVKSNRLALLIVLSLRFFQQFSGYYGFLTYSQLLFQSTISDISKEIASILVFSLQVVTSFLSSYVIDKFGRKPLLIFSCGGAFISLILEGIYFTIKEEFPEYDDKRCSWMAFFGMMMFIFFYSIGLGALTNVILGEIAATVIKNKTQMLANCVCVILMASTAEIFHYFFVFSKIYVPFYLYAISQLIGIVFFCKILPETKNKSMEAIQEEMRKIVFC